MTTTEKDAMALATLAACEAYIDTTDSFHDRPGEGSPVAEHRKARAHLASRIAELEAERDEANERAARTAAQYQHEFEAHGQTIDRAERAEAELAAVREAAGLNILGMPVVENPKVPDGYAAIIQGGTVVGVIKVADATDAARGGE